MIQLENDSMPIMELDTNLVGNEKMRKLMKHSERCGIQAQPERWKGFSEVRQRNKHCARH